jgi:toxin ParE1/3/4
LSTRSLEVHPDADFELEAGITWYAGRSVDVAIRFRDVIRLAVAVARDRPERGPSFLHGTRRLVLKDFPYSIVYKAYAERTVIYAFAHDKRKPGYWKSRLSWDSRA